MDGTAIIGVARELGIPTLAAVHSWDNLSTKNRMIYRYDGYLVWSAQMLELEPLDFAFENSIA